MVQQVGKRFYGIGYVDECWGSPKNPPPQAVWLTSISAQPHENIPFWLLCFLYCSPHTTDDLLIWHCAEFVNHNDFSPNILWISQRLTCWIYCIRLVFSTSLQLAWSIWLTRYISNSKTKSWQLWKNFLWLEVLGTRLLYWHYSMPLIWLR